MSRELLKQALDALEREQDNVYDATSTSARRCRPVIAAIRAELAQPAVEPVAWAMLRADGLVLDVICPDERDAYQGEYTVPLYASPAAPAPLVPFDRTTALVLLQAASKSGDPGAISLAAQLAGAAPCKDCGYVNFKCRCAPATAVAEPLTMERVFASDDIMAVNASIGLRMDQIMQFVHAVEVCHGIRALEVSHD